MSQSHAGYHALHLTGRLREANPGLGNSFEVQILTTRMDAWANWYHSRIYKPKIPVSARYARLLRLYNDEIITYLRALDLGSLPLPARPNPFKLRIRSADLFPDSKLR